MTGWKIKKLCCRTTVAALIAVLAYLVGGFINKLLIHNSYSASTPVSFVGATIRTDIPQLAPNTAYQGFDDNEQTVFHSQLNMSSGNIFIDFPQPVKFSMIEFLPQPGGEGLSARLPRIVQIRAKNKNDSQAMDIATLAIDKPTVAGRYAYTIPIMTRRFDCFIVELLGGSDYMTFSELRLFDLPAFRISGNHKAFSYCLAVVIFFLVFFLFDIIVNFLFLMKDASGIGADLRPKEPGGWSFFIASLTKDGYSIHFFIICMILAICCSLLAYVVMGLHWSGMWHAGFDSGDGLWMLATIKNAIHHVYWWWYPDLGAPLVSDMRDFPVPEYLHMFILILIGKLSQSAEFAWWLYYVCSFGLTFFFTSLLLRRLGISTLPLLILSFCYAFIPYHTMRLGHYGLSLYYTLPIGLYGIVLLYVNCAGFILKPDSPSFPQLFRHSLKTSVIVLVIDAIMCAGGAYYFIFYLLLLTAACVFVTLNSGNLIRRFYSFCIYASHIAFSIILFKLMLLPFESINSSGANLQRVSHRFIIESDIYATSLMWLIFPSRGTFFSSWINLKDFPTAIAITENVFAFIGIPASIGLLLSFFIIITRLGYTRNMSKNIQLSQHKLILLMSFLLVFIFMWSTYGGFNALFAYIVTPQIRCWNRLSILLSLLGICLFGLLFDYAWNNIQRFLRFPKMVLSILLLTLLAIVCVTQFGRFTTKESAMSRVEADKSGFRFFTKLEGRPAHCGRPQVLNLPFLGHPEALPPEGVGHYEYFFPYMHTNNIRWSFGGCRGRPAGDAYERLCQLPPAKLIIAARRLGFTGILVARPTQYRTLTDSLTGALGSPPDLVSDDNRWAYFDLPGSLDSKGISTDETFKIINECRQLP